MEKIKVFNMPKRTWVSKLIIAGRFSVFAFLFYVAVVMYSIGNVAVSWQIMIALSLYLLLNKVETIMQKLKDKGL